MRPNILFTLLLSAIIPVILMGQPHSAQYDKSCADYWLDKMSDPNVNYHRLVAEFDQYWAGKKPDKNSGYKLFRRWQHANFPYVKPDGYLLPPDHDMTEYNKFLLQNPGEGITGTWDLVGPTIFPQQYYGVQCPGLGRVSALAFHPTNPDILFAGAPVGGLWKTVDGGDNWFSLNTDDIHTMGVSSIVVDFTDPNIIYFGSGDRDGSESMGLGVFKSFDGGLSWTQYNSGMGNRTVSKLLMFPDDHNSLLAAATDGVYLTVDGGDNWTMVRPSSKSVKDLVFKPGDPQYIYAARGGDIYRSTDRGLTWVLTKHTAAQRIVLAVTPANPEKLYALATLDSKFYRLYSSDDSGSSFTEIVSTGMEGEGQGGYNLDLAVDLWNPQVLYAGMINVFKSTNGGASFTMIANAGQIHADQHIFEISPQLDDYLFIGNDGGVYKMWIGGGTHPVTTISDGLTISEVYRLSVAENDPNLMICGMQDCGSYVTSADPWLHRLSGDGMNCRIDYSNSSIMYGSSQNGHIARSMNGGNSFHTIAYDSIAGIYQPGGWYSPFILDQFSPNIMFAGYVDVFRSINVNTTDPASIVWTNISNGQLSGNIIDVMEQSPVDGNIMFVADKEGYRLFMTSNAYNSSPVWTEIIKPLNRWVTWIEAHPTDPDIVFITTNSIVYKYRISTASWENITGNLPNVSKLCIVYQENSNEGLYVGTTTGVFYKNGGMPGWVVYKSGMPTTKVFDMEINYHTNPPQLFAATFGRGIWKTEIPPNPDPNLVATDGASQVTGTVVQMTVNYQNQSQISYTDPFHIGYYLSLNNVITTTDVFIGEVSRPSIWPMAFDVGILDPVDVSLIVPEIPPGTYYIGAVLDNKEEVSELLETDNVYLATNQVVIPVPPDPPANIQASDGTYSDRIRVTWDNLPNGTWYYSVYRSLDDNPATAVKISGNDWIQSTNFDDFNAPRGINVYYWVKASGNHLGLRPGDFSASDAGWWKLLPPTSVEATDGLYDDKIIITWTPPENGTHFRVYRNTVNNPATAVSISGIFWILNTTYTDLSVVSGTTYYYWVRAANSMSGAMASDYSASNSGWMAFASAPTLTASDGTYTDHVELVWNSIPGAGYYKVFWSLNNDPENSTACTGWQMDTTLNYNTGMHGTIVYFWVKASADQQGNVSTGYSEEETGWMNFVPPANVQATDGTMVEAVNITWNYVSGGSYYRVYRNLNSNPVLAQPVGKWFYGNQFHDTTGIPGRNQYYWVRVANDTLVTVSGVSSPDIGWGLLASPAVTATKGVYNDKVQVTWQPVNGGIAYRVFRSEAGSPLIDTLTEWSTSTNYFLEDLTPVMGTYYNYYVKAARSTSGLRESEAGVDLGYADECGNMVEDTAYRNIWFHGSTLEITQRVYNEGPFPFLNPGQVAFTLEADPYDGIPEYIVAYADIPPLGVNQYYDVQLAVDLDTVPYGPVPYGTWYVGCFMSWDWNNCETNFDDDYITWTDQSFVFTDAMHGTYTIGPVSCDFNGVEDALTALDSLGISDQVTFNLMPAAYNGQYTFVPVTGSEYARSILFQTDPAFSDTAEFIFAPTAENNYTLRCSNATNIHFKNLKLSTTGFSNYQSTYGRVIEFTGNCYNIQFINCLITGFPDESHMSEDNAVIYCYNSGSDHLRFLNNTIRYGYMGFCMEGMNLATSPLTNLEIKENTIEGFISSGIDLKYVDKPIITGNKITAPPTLTSYHYGIDIKYLKGGCDISGNTILLFPSDWAMYGISLVDFNLDASGQALVANNFIMLHSDVTFAYGILTANINKIRFYHNSIHLSGIPTTFSVCILLDCTMPAMGGYDNSLINNIFSNRLGGYALLYSENAYNNQLLTHSDHNDFFSSGADLIFFRNSYPLQTLNQWNLETGFDLNSMNADPVFVSDFDLHSNSPLLDGAAYPLPEVPLDFDGELRNPVNPDIGADEYDYVMVARNLDIKVNLEGAFEVDKMNTNLNSGNLLPLFQPYNAAPWFYTGSESVSSIPATNIVDWVLIELRDAQDAASATGATALAHRAGFLLDNGSVTGTDGISPMQFTESVSQKLFAVVKHRNHIAVMSSGDLSFNGVSYEWDFTSGTNQAYGGGNAHKQVAPGIWGMAAADGNADGQVNNGDKNDVWIQQAGTGGYKSGDFNLDAQVNNGDKNDVWVPNTGSGGQVPDSEGTSGAADDTHPPVKDRHGYQCQVPE